MFIPLIRLNPWEAETPSFTFVSLTSSKTPPITYAVSEMTNQFVVEVQRESFREQQWIFYGHLPKTVFKLYAYLSL